MLYMNYKPAFALVLLGVTLVTYWEGLFLSLELRDNSEELKVRRRKRLAWLFALLGLLPLLVCKYYNFINESVSTGLAAVGLQFALPGLNWAIPVGISFFTCSTMHSSCRSSRKCFLDLSVRRMNCCHR